MKKNVKVAKELVKNTGYDEWEWIPMSQPPIKDIIDESMNPEQIGKEAIFL